MWPILHPWIITTIKYFESCCFGGEGSVLFFKNLLIEALCLHQAQEYSCSQKEDKKEEVVVKKFQVLYTRLAFEAAVWLSWLKLLFGFVPTVVSVGQAQLGKEFISVPQTDTRHLPI